MAAAVNGWLFAHSDYDGRVYYRVTATGWREIDAPSTPPDVGPLPVFDPDAARRYRVAQDLKIAAMGRDKPPLVGEIGSAPLPASMVGVPIHRSAIAFKTGELAK